MKIPDVEHWAIITDEQNYVPGDPSHGYPEWYEESIGYQAFTDYDDFYFEVSRMTIWGKKFQAVQVKPMKVETTVVVTVK